ncbi:MAG: Stk1 family Ser/Thr kinase, partial [Frankiales bacterium]|nr:Stk1 family Ser/Thr kinase [Frankiales bacterium]
GGRARLLFVVVIVAAIVAIALLWRPAGGSSPGKQPSKSPTRSASPSATTRALAVKDYVGRPYAQVAADLVALGLTPNRQNTADAAEADTVVGIGNGPFRRGDVVTVTVSTGPQPVVTPSDPASDTQQPGESGKIDKGHGADKKGNK